MTSWGDWGHWGHWGQVTDTTHKNIQLFGHKKWFSLSVFTFSVIVLKLKDYEKKKNSNKSYMQ